jgi:hypothetical protein
MKARPIARNSRVPSPGPRERDRVAGRRLAVARRVVDVRERAALDFPERAELDPREAGRPDREELRVPPVEAARGRDAVLVATPEL